MISSHRTISHIWISPYGLDTVAIARANTEMGNDSFDKQIIDYSTLKKHYGDFLLVERRSNSTESTIRCYIQEITFSE